MDEHRPSHDTDGASQPRARRRAFRGSALLRLHVLETRIWLGMRERVSSRSYPVTVGVLALVITLTMTIPFSYILIGTILLRRDRWWQIVALSSLGSAIGGLVLYLIFHHLGWSRIAAAYPDLAQSQAWADATRWVSAYGIWALLAIAATPFPQTPALIFAAVSRLPLAEVFLALLLGKLLKYGAYGFLTAKFPSLFRFIVARTRDRRLNRG